MFQLPMKNLQAWSVLKLPGFVSLHADRVHCARVDVCALTAATSCRLQTALSS